MKIRGFTLIELMVVVAIVGILAAIALPSFNEQMRKGRRSEAMKGISDLQLREEHFRSNNALYGDLAAILAPTTAAAYNTGNPFYSFTITGNNATSYVITATPKNAQAGDRCGNFVLTNSAGAIAKTAAASNCWQ